MYEQWFTYIQRHGSATMWRNYYHKVWLSIYTFSVAVAKLYVGVAVANDLGIKNTGCWEHNIMCKSHTYRYTSTNNFADSLRAVIISLALLLLFWCATFLWLCTESTCIYVVSPWRVCHLQKVGNIWAWVVFTAYTLYFKHLCSVLHISKSTPM